MSEVLRSYMMTTERTQKHALDLYTLHMVKAHPRLSTNAVKILSLFFLGK